MTLYTAALSLLNQLFRRRAPEIIQDDPDLHRLICFIEALIIVTFARNEDHPTIPPGNFSRARALDLLHSMLLFNPPHEERFIIEVLIEHIRNYEQLGQVPVARVEPIGMLTEEGGFGWS